jgi:thiol-disulfide isomerase/thioredoxin
MGYRLPLLIALAISDSAVWSAGCASTSPRADTAPPPGSLPPTSVLTLDGSATDLGTVIRGRAAIVTLWATWCDACVSEFDALKRLQAQARARGDAIVVGVAVGEKREAVAAFATQRGLGYAQLVDEDFRLADALGQRRVPATLVVDRAGRIVFRGGALDAAGLAAFRATLGGAE